MKILVYDHGLCTEAAVKLAKTHQVAYFTPWQRDFPETDLLIGKNLDGLERVENFSTALDRCDLVACFDTFSADREHEAERAGKPVFGARGAEKMELDRVHMKQVQKRLGLPTQHYEVITGIDDLIRFLMQPANKDKWVKATGKHRGLIETFYHKDWETTRSQEGGQLMADFGPVGNSLTFLIEDPVGECEPGYDGIVVAGEYLTPHIIGYEDKDETYIGHVTTTFPSPIHRVTKTLLPLLKSYGSSCFVSFEVRIDKKQDAYLIDPCLRAPHPPMACELEVFTNFADIVVNGARNKAIPVAVPSGVRYCAAIEIKSDWVQNHWCQLDFPQRNRANVKLQKAYFDPEKQTYWALPGSFVIATCVGTGATIDEARKQAKKVASEFHAKGMYYDEASLDKLCEETVVKGKNYGIQF